MHIAIAGNIGSGKTTLTKMLADHYGWHAQFEKVVDNPYLEDYYKDLQRWSFNLEVFFLKERFKDMLEIGKSEKTIIQDRSIYEGVYVFAKNNHKQGTISDLDFETYMDLFEQMLSMTRVPDLMIYLRASIEHLVGNIQKRGRDYEQNIEVEYLERLNRRYNDWIENNYRGEIFVIDKDNNDFLENAKVLDSLYDRLDAIKASKW